MCATFDIIPTRLVPAWRRPSGRASGMRAVPSQDYENGRQRGPPPLARVDRDSSTRGASAGRPAVWLNNEQSMRRRPAAAVRAPRAASPNHGAGSSTPTDALRPRL